MYRKACASFGLFFLQAPAAAANAARPNWCMPARQSGAREITPHRIGANNSFLFLLIYLIHFAIVMPGFH
jgi:hypothetical protein